MAKYKVVITDDRHGTYQVEKDILDSIDAEVIIKDCKTVEDVIFACKDADGILVNLAPIPSEVIDQLDKCKVISRYGVGFDNVDVSACTKKGIYLTNVPNYCSEEVSDHALALLMACVRKVAARDAAIRKGQWMNKEPIYRISGKTFTFLGFGIIARCLLRKIKGLNFKKIFVYDPFIDKEIIDSYGAEKVDWLTALKYSDYISIHLPLNNETKDLINKEAFELMKTNAIIINTSRGPIIDEDALIEALRTNKINCAGLDVFSKEPLEADNLLLKMNNCVLTDHIGWYSEESFIDLKIKATENVKNVLIGNSPKYPINKI